MYYISIFSCNFLKFYNPYAICAKSVGTTSRECSDNYSFENIPNAELQGYASLHGIEIPSPYDRGELIENIRRWKEQKYGKK